MTHGAWARLYGAHIGIPMSHVNRGVKGRYCGALTSNVKGHLIDRRTRLKNSSYKPGLKHEGIG